MQRRASPSQRRISWPRLRLGFASPRSFAILSIVMFRYRFRDLAWSLLPVSGLQGEDLDLSTPRRLTAYYVLRECNTADGRRLVDSLAPRRECWRCSFFQHRWCGLAGAAR